MQKTRNAEIASAQKPGSRGVNRSAVRVAMDRFVVFRGGSKVVPTPEEVAHYLQTQVETLGRTAAHADFAYLQKAAAEAWGAPETSFFARVLRDARVTKKPRLKTRWDRAARAVANLPAAWQDPMQEVLERSRNVQFGTRGLVWSASRITAVCEALARWWDYCSGKAQDTAPNGARLETYAVALIAGGVSRSSVGDYIERILAGHQVITGRPASAGAEFVFAEYRSRKSAPVTKSTAQIVGASAIFDLGRKLFEAARARPTRSATVAKEARDGILLMFATALGERATALSSLAFGSTVQVGARPEIHLRLPGGVLKMSERKKAGYVRTERLRRARVIAT